VPSNESKLGVSKTYWLDFHKPIYMAFKLSDTLPIYSNKPTLFPFIQCHLKFIIFIKTKPFMSWSYGKDGKIWGKNVGKLEIYAQRRK
jgi:hypothetical protein